MRSVHAGGRLRPTFGLRPTTWLLVSYNGYMALLWLYHFAKGRIPYLFPYTMAWLLSDIPLVFVWLVTTWIWSQRVGEHAARERASARAAGPVSGSPAWHPDPWGSGVRWFNGSRWTERTDPESA